MEKINFIKLASHKSEKASLKILQTGWCLPPLGNTRANDHQIATALPAVHLEAQLVLSTEVSSTY